MYLFSNQFLLSLFLVIQLEQRDGELEKPIIYLISFLRWRVKPTDLSSLKFFWNMAEPIRLSEIRFVFPIGLVYWLLERGACVCFEMG